jgi:hypothetical protein
MNSYTDEGVAHAELLLVTYLKRKTLLGTTKTKGAVETYFLIPSPLALSASR